MAIAGMILGIVAMVFAFIPVVGVFVSVPCIVVGLPLSIVGLVMNRRREQGIGMAIAGIATNVVAVIIVIVWVVIIGMVTKAVVDELEEVSDKIAVTSVVSNLDDSAMDSAIRISVGSPTAGDIEDGFDYDYFVFEALEGREYRVDVALVTLADSLLTLYGSDGSHLAQDDDSGEDFASRIEWVAPASGNYFLEVTHAGFGSGTYTLTVIEE